ncbi:hypothetical protein FACS189450_09570 [Spirochaetia bacterium]|nr:hypothetical protein FACS189450_09570 [Spirochaetia bacterium]
MSDEKQRFESKQKTRKVLLIAAACVVAIAIAIGIVVAIGGIGTKKIAIGSKNYTEQLILGNMLADIIEAHTDYKVERKLNLGGTLPCVEALKSGDIDVYVDYASTIFINALKKPVGDISKEAIYAVLESELPGQFNFMPLGLLGFDQPYELSVKTAFAAENNLKTIDDLKPIQDRLILSPSFEFVNREDGLIGVEKFYGIQFGSIIPMEAGLRYSALESGTANVIVTFGTDAMKLVTDLIPLEDPRHVFMPMDAVPFFNVKSFEKNLDVVNAVKLLLNTITNAEMIAMNYEVDHDKQLPEDVAKNFLRRKGLIE